MCQGKNQRCFEISGPINAAITPPARTNEMALLFKFAETLSAAA